jgi:hypothetical protein
MIEYTVVGHKGRKSVYKEKTVITICYSQQYADFWVGIAKSEGFVDVEILKEEIL